MFLKKVYIKNYRLFTDHEFEFDKRFTVIIGKNNSGKTSLIDLFNKLSRKKLRFSDFSIEAQKRFIEQFEELIKSIDLIELFINEDNFLNNLPKIEIKLIIEYNESDDLSSLSDFILDLNDDKKDIEILIEYGIFNFKKVIEQLENYLKKANQKVDILRFLNYFAKFFEFKVYAVYGDRKIATSKDISDIFGIETIYAQRKVSFEYNKGNQKGGLSKSISDYYNDLGELENDKINFENDVLELSQELDKKYEEVFKHVLEELKEFNIPNLNTDEIKFRAYFKPGDLVKDILYVFYVNSNIELPEDSEGLGYNNLIYITVKLLSFFHTYKEKKENNLSFFQIIFIEEPEVHLHPQMIQEFIRKIVEFIEKKDWEVQLVLTTHSSHLVAEGIAQSDNNFSYFRYFALDNHKLEIKNLKEFSITEDEIKFIRHYIELTKSDLFFADKIILVEGTVERLLLPLMIKKVSPELAKQYYSIIEIGGAYAHIFVELLKFLNTKTLIITDIDSYDKSIGEKVKIKRAELSDNVISTNSAIKKLLNFSEEPKIKELLEKSEEEKIIENIIRLEYQTEEYPNRVGRSFEEAFILANPEIIKQLYPELRINRKKLESLPIEDICEFAFEIAEKIVNKDKKTGFALRLLSEFNNDWKVPQYIKNGLEWLKE